MLKDKNSRPWESQQDIKRECVRFLYERQETKTIYTRETKSEKQCAAAVSNCARDACRFRGCENVSNIVAFKIGSEVSKE